MILPLLKAIAKWVGIEVPLNCPARPEDFPDRMRREYAQFHRLFQIHHPRCAPVGFAAVERNAVVIARLSRAEASGLSDDDLRQRGVTWPVEPERPPPWWVD